MKDTKNIAKAIQNSLRPAIENREAKDLASKLLSFWGVRENKGSCRMKKIRVIIFLFVLSVPVFSAENIPFKGSFTETGHLIVSAGTSEDNILIPAYNLIYPFRTSSLDRYKTLGFAAEPGLLYLSYPFKITTVSTGTQKREKPPLNPLRIAGEIYIGLSGTAVGMLLSAIFFGEAIVYPESDAEFWAAFIGILSFMSLGNASGVFLIGNIGDETGSFWATWLGSSLGLVIGMTFDIFLLRSDEAIFTMIGLSACGPIAFNMTRRYKSPSMSGTALFNITDSKVSLAFPSITFKPGSSDKSGFVKTINLMNISF